MNVMRCTILDRDGGVSFVAHAEVLGALVAACSKNPDTADQMLTIADSYYRDLRDRVMNGLAIFDERNVHGNYEAIHRALDFCAPFEQPPFRVVDERTRQASLQPVKAGAVLFNLVSKRIVQLQNTFREITRSGRGRVYDGSGATNRVYSYRLPRDWAIVP